MQRKAERTKKSTCMSLQHTQVLFVPREHGRYRFFSGSVFFLSSIPKLNYSTRSCLSTHTASLSFLSSSSLSFILFILPRISSSIKRYWSKSKRQDKKEMEKKKRELMRRRRKISIILYNLHK